MTVLRLEGLKRHSDVLRLRSGNSVTVRFVEPRDADELQNYFRSLSTRSRYNRFHAVLENDTAIVIATASNATRG